MNCPYKIYPYSEPNLASLNPKIKFTIGKRILYLSNRMEKEILSYSLDR